jgi:endonuclease YncB( thermonuclease family)
MGKMIRKGNKKLASIVTKLIGFEKAIVYKVFSGDTIVVKRGFADYEKVKLSGIMSPKKGPFLLSIPEEGAMDSYIYLEKLLPPGTPIYMEFGNRNKDIYGRFLRYVWLDIPNDKTILEVKEKMVNAILLKEGLVETYLPEKCYENIFTTIQNEAKKEKKGIWEHREINTISEETIQKYEKDYNENKDTEKDYEDLYLQQIAKIKVKGHF